MAVSRGLLVLGMHRSGTSCLTGLLATAGAWIGAPVVPDPAPKRSRRNEDVEVRKLNNRLLKGAGGRWNSPPESVEVDDATRATMQALLAGYAEHPLWALKDPRMILMVDHWLPVLGSVELIGTYRHPMAVARSHLERDDMPIMNALKLWHRYNQELVRHHRRQAFPLVSFDRVGEPYLQQFEKLATGLGMAYDRDKARAFYTTNFIRNAGQAGEPVAAECAETYEYLVRHTIPLDG